VPIGPDELAEILYTSGTTGLPKGVACSHLAIMAHDLPPDAAASTGPVSFLHSFPIGTQAGQETLRVPLRIGGRTAIALPSFDPDLLCALVERHRVVRLQLVPAMAQLLVVSNAPRRHEVSSVRRIILSSAPAAPALFTRLAEAFPGATVWNAYALTEAGPARTLMQWDPTRPTAVGRPVGETEIRIVDGDGTVLPSGKTGEIWLRRRGTPTREYYNDPVATAAAFLGGWVHTGDVGHVDADGFLHLTDRRKDLIISGGTNVSSVEVENALYEHPAVVDAAVVGIPHPVLGEDVAAAVVVRSPTTERELQDVVRSRLAEHKVPHRVALVDQLPRNQSGKVLKAEVRALLAAGTGAAPGFVAARDETESVVVSVWEAVLGVANVGIHDDFFALGGHSLAAAQITARLRDALGVDVPVAAVFEAPTPAELARVVAG
jgi:acyl-CoA synthetase (AMP-forming)/AMP-acid ligase II